MPDQITTMSVVNDVLKNNQTAKAVVPQYNRKCPLYDKINIGTGMWAESGAGYQYIQPITTAPMTAGTRNVSDARVDASTITNKRAVYDPRSYIEAAMHFNFDVQIRADGTGPTKAFINNVTQQVTGCGEAVAAEISRQTYQATGTGTLCGVAVTTGATDANIITFTDVNWEKTVKRGWIDIGTPLDIWTASSGVPTTSAPVATSRRITAITPSASADASTITLDGPALSTASNDAVAIGIAGNRVWNGSANEVREITSVQVMADASSTIGGLSPSTVPRWAGVTANASTTSSTTLTAFSIAAYQYWLELIDAKQVDVDEEDYFTVCDTTRFNHASVVLANSTNQAVRYAKTSDLEWKGTTMIPLTSGTTLVKDRMAPPNEILGIPLKHLEYVNPRNEKLSWAETAPNQYVKWDDNHGLVGMGFWNGDIATDRRGAIGRLRYVL